MNVQVKLITALMLLSAGSLAVAAGNPTAGETKSLACHACHGPDGVSINDLWPNLAGQKRGYLEKQLKAFRDGSRQDPVMAIFAKPLSDEDIADIAAFYSGLSGVALPPAKLH